MQNVVTMTVIIFGNSVQNQRKVITEPDIFSRIVQDKNMYWFDPEITCLNPTKDGKISVLFWQTALEHDS